MIDPLVETAERAPDMPALADAERRWTWHDLLADANDLAGRLDIPVGSRLALLARDTGTAVVAIHAIRLAGGVLVPLNRRLTVDEMPPLVARSGVTGLIHDAAHDEVADALMSAVPTLRLMPLGPRTVPADRSVSSTLDAATLGALVFTSGTSGVPRGVLLTHANLLASARAWNTFLDARLDDHWLAALPLSHVAGLGIILRSVCSGARLTVHDRFEPEAVLAALGKGGVSHLSLVPTQLARLLDSGPVSAPRLRGLLLGGAPVPVPLVERATAAGLPVVPTYGLTEAASGVTASLPREAARHPGSAGRPLPGTRVRVVADDHSGVGLGDPGEILVSGPTVFAGYDGDPAAADRVLRDGWLHTGDLGTFDRHGRLTVIDRLDDLIISGGENISPAEVEAVLAAHPAVADVAVVGRPDATWGAVPTAAVVARPGWILDPSDIESHARQRLAAFKVPRTIEVVPHIPRTASGKIIRRDVRWMLDSIAADLFVDRPDGARIHVRRRGRGPVLVLLHATLSNALELEPLAIELSERHAVLAIDRRSAGASVMPPDDIPAPIDVQVHIDDVIAVLDTLAPTEQVFVFGHSYGGCIGLELGARHPDRVNGAFLFEPPYLGVLPDTAEASVALSERITRIAHRDGLGAAALAFLETVNGAGITRRLPPDVLARFELEGRGAVADSALAGFEPTGLTGVRAKVCIGLGGRSRGPYAAVAAGLIGRIPTLHIEHFPTLGHGGPIGGATIVAPAVLAYFATSEPLVSPVPAPGGSP